MRVIMAYKLVSKGITMLTWNDALIMTQTTVLPAKSDSDIMFCLQLLR